MSSLMAVIWQNLAGSSFKQFAYQTVSDSEGPLTKADAAESF